MHHIDIVKGYDLCMLLCVAIRVWLDAIYKTWAVTPGLDQSGVVSKFVDYMMAHLQGNVEWPVQLARPHQKFDQVYGCAVLYCFYLAAQLPFVNMHRLYDKGIIPFVVSCVLHYNN